MNQKQIGIIIIIIGILFFSFVKIQHDEKESEIQEIMNETGSCLSPEGMCLHEMNETVFNYGYLISTLTIALGIYLVFFDKTQKILYENQIKVSEALKAAKQTETKQTALSAFLEGFDEVPKKILKVIYEEEGIQQSTLKFRADVSKTELSIQLKELEEKGFIKREKYKKTNKVYPVKQF